MAEPVGTQASSEYGGFWIRFLAYLVDGVILWIATVIIIVVSAFLGTAGAIVAVVVPLLLMVLYFPIMHASARQATFGKALLGMKVEHAASGGRISILRALGRDVLGKLISTIVLMIGFLMAAFTGRKQALHDMIASTVVAREGTSHVVAALAVAVLGYAGPFILVMFLGVGILAGLMGGMGAAILGGMMADSSKQAQKSAPMAPSAPGVVAPSAPSTPPPTAASAADVDKLLVPLTGLDKPGSTRAGPAVLELSTFFSGGNPSIWVMVHAPLAVSRASVVVTQVADSANQSRYDPKNSFESEFFQAVQLSASSSGTPRMEGPRSVRLTPGTTEQQVQKIDGVLKLVVPIGVRTLTFRGADAGKDQSVGAVKVTLISIKGDSVELEIGTSRDNVIQIRGFNAKGEPLSTQSTSWGGKSVTAKFAGPVDKAEADIAAEVAERSYPFTLTRGSSGAAVVAAAPTPAPKPAPAPAPAPSKAAPAPAPAKAAPPPAPAKLVAAAPEVAPKPKPAPRKRAAAPKPPETQVTAVSPAPAPVPRAAPVPKTIVAPRYSDLMTAVLNRDAAGVTELLEFGKWADKPDRRGTTPLMVAATLGDTASAEALLKAGADAGRALSIAREQRDQAMLALLQRYGAR